ncbi:unnamed protein product [Cuscuta campestris]|uniref:glucan endo-1,3-beta-D-glucosidase n=1 Tax=Cuscuta campestris TaxID=132261 RepID=A0A484MC22_9ASTE|nr:unnamed protein product [Cuscuta campestris]
MSGDVGVCYGQLGNNLLNPTQSIDLIRHKLHAKRVKLYDANPAILDALRNTNIQVSVMVPNELIPAISTHQSEADKWVQTHVVPYYNETMIRYLLVGNEVLSNKPDSTWTRLVPAMHKIRRSVKSFKLNKIKVGTPLAMDMLESSFPPSNGTFRGDLVDAVIKPLLDFLRKSRSFFFIDVYTYFAWKGQPDGTIPLDRALLQPTNREPYVDPDSGLKYTHLLDQMIDAVFSAMKRAGYPDVRIFVAETGWPSSGGPGATICNAAVYNRNAVKKFAGKAGTPARPGVLIPAFVFALYNENHKPGEETERNFGLFYPTGSSVYDIDLSGKTEYTAPLEAETCGGGKRWCVVANGADPAAVAGALSYACGQGDGICGPIQKGRECYKAEDLNHDANYAFSSYWAQFRSSNGTCDFNGVAVVTATDPSYDKCMFPSVEI